MDVELLETWEVVKTIVFLDSYLGVFPKLYYPGQVTSLFYDL